MIPPNAKLVFKGVIFDVYQWEQTMFDGSVEIFEKLKRPDTVDVIAVINDKILVLDEIQPHSTAAYQCLPGGRVDPGEDALTAAKRELLEETGYASDDWELLRERSPIGKIEWVMHSYVARNCKKIAEQDLDAGEKISVALISFDQFLDLADNDLFHTDLKLDLVRAKLDSVARDGLRRTLFTEK